MPSFSYTIPSSITSNERSPLAERSTSENIVNTGPFKAQHNVVGPFTNKLERIARRGGSENSPSPQKEAGKSETEAAVEAAVNLLEKCALAARARSNASNSAPEDEAEAAEESAVCLVRACAAAAVKHSGKQEQLSKRDATKLMLQARVADLEKEIAQSKSLLELQEREKQDWKTQCAEIYTNAVESYERKVEPFLRRAQNPFEPADQHAIQVRLTEVQMRINESKKLLRKKQDESAKGVVGQFKEQLKQHETVMHGLVGELTSVLGSHAQRRAALEEQLEDAVKEHSDRAAELQQQLQKTIQDNLRSRDELAAELNEPLTGCDQKRLEIEKAVEQIEAVLMQ